MRWCIKVVSQASQLHGLAYETTKIVTLEAPCSTILGECLDHHYGWWWAIGDWANWLGFWPMADLYNTHWIVDNRITAGRARTIRALTYNLWLNALKMVAYQSNYCYFNCFLLRADKQHPVLDEKYKKCPVNAGKKRTTLDYIIDINFIQ